MSWRWISITSLLAAVVIFYELASRRDMTQITGEDRPAQAGYYLKDAVITDTDASGAARIRLAARRIEQDAGSNDVALSQVHVDYYAEQQRHWILTADRGRVPGGSETVTFAGDVVLRSADGEPPATIRTESLTVDMSRDVASTTEPVAIVVSGHTLHAEGLRADLKGETLQLESSVHGTFQRN
ncbi:MAG TPA: LPS export ABC transporter periplasmic protein LptC [Gammaproteobacteria bacterium]|nr:LPS export ABC transporter periplasmic protein LptC [Gammaproteobacteria bacterium]